MWKNNLAPSSLSIAFITSVLTLHPPSFYTAVTWILHMTRTHSISYHHTHMVACSLCYSIYFLKLLLLLNYSCLPFLPIPPPHPSQTHLPPPPPPSYTAERKKDLIPFATAWMELESIMSSEISQAVSDKYHMISPLTGTESTREKKQTKYNQRPWN